MGAKFKFLYIYQILTVLQTRNIGPLDFNNTHLINNGSLDFQTFLWPCPGSESLSKIRLAASSLGCLCFKGLDIMFYHTPAAATTS